MTDRSWKLAAVLAVSAALGLGLGLLTIASPKVGLAGAVVLVLVAAVVYARLFGLRAGLVSLLITTSFIDRFTFHIGSVDIRAEQIAALIGLAFLVYLFVTAQRGLDLWRPNLPEALLGAWFLVALISSVTASPHVSRSVKGVGLLVISSLGLLLPRRLLDKSSDRAQMELVIQVLLVTFAAEATYGTGAYLAHVFGSNVSLGNNLASGHLNSYGTLWEPNVFGAFCASGALAWVWLGPRYFRFAWVGIALCLGGMIVSFTRAAWVVAFLVLGWSLFAPPLSRRGWLRQVNLGVAGAVVIALLAVGAGRVADYYLPVTSGPGGGKPPSRSLLLLLENPIDVIGRIDQFKIVWPDFRRHPVLGSGVASYGELHPVAGQPEQHIANLELTLLNDTGVVGLLVFFVFAGAIAVPAWRRRQDPIVAGLGAAVTVIAITNIATETTELMISWLLLGLLMMAVDAASPVAPTPSMKDR